MKLQKIWNNHFFFFEIFESLSLICFSTSDFLSSTALKTSCIRPSKSPSETSGDMDSAIKELDKLKSLVNSPDADKYRVGATPASSVLKLAYFGPTEKIDN